jgi:hypothetical protein
MYYIKVLSRYLSIFHSEHEIGWNDPVSYTKDLQIITGPLHVGRPEKTMHTINQAFVPKRICVRK